MSRTTATFRHVQPFFVVDAQAAASEADKIYNITFPTSSTRWVAMDRYSSAMFNLLGMQVASGQTTTTLKTLR